MILSPFGTSRRAPYHSKFLFWPRAAHVFPAVSRCMKDGWILDYWCNRLSRVRAAIYVCVNSCSPLRQESLSRRHVLHNLLRAVCFDVLDLQVRPFLMQHVNALPHSFQEVCILVLWQCARLLCTLNGLLHSKTVRVDSQSPMHCSVIRKVFTSTRMIALFSSNHTDQLRCVPN